CSDLPVCYSFQLTSFTSGVCLRSRQRWISFLAFGGHWKSLIASISTLRGHSFDFTWTSTTSAELTPTMSKTPRDAAARVQASRRLRESALTCVRCVSPWLCSSSGHLKKECHP